MLHKASSDGAVEMVRFLATECSSVDLEAHDKVNGPCVCVRQNRAFITICTNNHYVVGIECKHAL